MNELLDIVIIGSSITSSWGNVHATTYRGLVRELVARGHRILFLERNVPLFAQKRDLPHPPYARTEFYLNLAELKDRFEAHVRNADFAIVGSNVPEGGALGEWVTSTAHGLTAFYDIDTPATLAKLARGENECISRELIPRYRLYLSSTGGPTLQRIERDFHSPAARPLYCSVDPELYFPEQQKLEWALGCVNTHSADLLPVLERLLLQPARSLPEEKFVVAGALYPTDTLWPPNVQRIENLPSVRYRDFYNSQRFTLNIPRAETIHMGYSPGVRLFKAAACGVPIVSDWWSGLDDFFRPDIEILVARSCKDVTRILRQTTEAERLAIASRARKRVLAEHTTAHRAAELENYALDCLVAF